MDTGLRDKVVLVTGATANIGKGIALAFVTGPVMQVDGGVMLP